MRMFGGIACQTFAHMLRAGNALQTDLNRPLFKYLEPNRPAPSFKRPFDPRSFWNVYPVNPILAQVQITTPDTQGGVIDSGIHAGLYQAFASDPAVDVYGLNDHNGPSVPNEQRRRIITVPHFPAGVVVPEGTDKPVDIIDEELDLIHSFYGMQYSSERDRWEASSYAITRLDGDGWGYPANPYNIRAAGVPPFAGALRSWELNLPIVEHVLAILPNTLQLRLEPEEPATLEDYDAGTTYTGTVPMGSLLMLPQDFDVAALSSSQAQCIARTLMKYGGRVIDRTDVPYFLFQAEHGSGWGNNERRNWYTDLETIRDALRLVTGQYGWKTRNGAAVTPISFVEKDVISMRGWWRKVAGRGAAGGSYRSDWDGAKGAYVFEDSEGDVTMSVTRRLVPPHFEGSGQNDQPCWSWLLSDTWYRNPVPGVAYAVTAYGEGDVSGNLQLCDSEYKPLAETGYLAPGHSTEIIVPDAWDKGGIGRQYVRRRGSTGQAWCRMEMIRS